MKRINNTVLSAYIICILTTSGMYARESDSIKKTSPFTFETTYVGDLVSNFSGGLETGTTYLGLANIKAGFDTGKANWWKGGQFYINMGNTHGGEPSAELVGDFQGVSNIEAGNLTFMYELWYKQSLGKFEITVGLQDLNADFATSENGALFSNSSFGIHSGIADNIPAPIFPLTALGASVQYKLSDSYRLLAAIFDGTPDEFEINPYNIYWKLEKNQGMLAVAEFQVGKSLVKGHEAEYKVGGYYHKHSNGKFNKLKNGGIYFVGDQQINDNLSLFSQIGFSPRKHNCNNYYGGIGLNYRKLFKNRENDQFGLAVNHAGLSDNGIGSETAVEVTYQYQLCDNIYLRPDIQYIINPAGTDSKLENALVGFLRIGINY